MTSAIASLTEMVVPVTITVQPTNLKVMQGSNATFTVAAYGNTPFSYQWYNFGSGAISGATNASLNLINVQSNDADYYYVIITSVYNSSSSSIAAVLSVVNPAIDCDGNGPPDAWQPFGFFMANPDANPFAQ